MLIKKLKNATFELALQSKTYGLLNLLKSKRLFHKILWIVFMFASSCVCAIYVLDELENFFLYKAVTVIQSDLEQPIQFPSVSFCSYVNNSFNNKSLKSILKSCSFNYNEQIQLNPDDYFESFTSYLGVCYRFNSGKNLSNQTIPFLKSTIGGLDDSFTFQLRAPGGIVLWIHEHTDPPLVIKYNMHHGNRVFASSSFYTQIVIDKIVEKQLDLPYNDCLKDVNEFSLNKTLINHIQNNNETYSHVRCLELCFELFYLEGNYCNCTNASLGNVWQQCWFIQEKEVQSSCTWVQKQNFFADNLIDICSSYCPLKCDYIKYSLEISSLQENTPGVVRFKAFYRSLSVTSIIQEPSRRLIDLVASIGGIFGLFVGLSFISIIEIIEVLTECVFLIYEHVSYSNKVNLFETNLK